MDLDGQKKSVYLLFLHTNVGMLGLGEGMRSIGCHSSLPLQP